MALTSVSEEQDLWEQNNDGALDYGSTAMEDAELVDYQEWNYDKGVYADYDKTQGAPKNSVVYLEELREGGKNYVVRDKRTGDFLGVDVEGKFRKGSPEKLLDDLELKSWKLVLDDETLVQSIDQIDISKESETFLQADREERKEEHLSPSKEAKTEKLYNISHNKDNEFKMNITLPSPEGFVLLFCFGVLWFICLFILFFKGKTETKVLKGSKGLVDINKLLDLLREVDQRTAEVVKKTYSDFGGECGGNTIHFPQDEVVKMAMNKVPEEDPKVKERKKKIASLKAKIPAWGGSSKEKYDVFLDSLQFFDKGEYIKFVGGLDVKKYSPRNIDGSLAKFRQKGDMDGMIAYGKEIVSQANRALAYTYRLNYTLGEIAVEVRKQKFAVSSGGRRTGSLAKDPNWIEFCQALGRSPSTVDGYMKFYDFLDSHPKFKRAKTSYNEMLEAIPKIRKAIFEKKITPSQRAEWLEDW